MGEHQHVMYASKSYVEQVYSELYGNVDSVEVEKGSTVSGSVKGKLGSFFSFISSHVSGEVNRSEIHSINFDDEMWKAKRLANDILSDEEIPYISMEGDQLELNKLYRFSCEVMTKPFESEVDGEKYIQVSGEQDGVKFRGDTSIDNWGSRSHIIQSVRAVGRGETYPYQGLIYPIKETTKGEGPVEYEVKFLIICGPETELRDEWYDRQYE